MPRQTLFKSPNPQTEPWPPKRPREGLLSDEAAKDVYRAACAQIGEAVAANGFKYLKSKQRCSARVGRFIYEIAFQSSHYNVSGRHVQLWMHATVASPELQVWREQRRPGARASAHVAGGMVHLIGTRFALVQWELADPVDRQDTINDAVAFVHSDVLPYFRKFDDIPAVLSELASTPVPGFDLVPSVEFAHCFGSQQHAQATLDRFMGERPDLHVAIEAESASPSKDTLSRPSGYVQQVVYLHHQYQLRISCSP